MYYAEKVINGVLHYKTTPNGSWKPLSAQTLTQRVIKAEQDIIEWKQGEETRNNLREVAQAIGLA